MALNAEPMFQALFERMKTLSVNNGGPFVTVRRRHPGDTPLPQDQPALYVEGRNRWPKQQINFKTKWEIGALITIYLRNDGDSTTTAMTKINEYISLVEGQLERKAGEQIPVGGNKFQTTLGGLCRAAWISEREAHGIMIVEGIVDNQGMILIPVDMIAAADGG